MGKRDCFNNLYSQGYLKSKIVECLPILGYAKGELGNLNGYAQLTVKDGAISDNFVFVNKLIPHSQYDLMIMANDSPAKVSILDLSKKSCSMLMGSAYQFLVFLGLSEIMQLYSLNNDRFQLCYNYNRDTIDRESGMVIKKYHLHLNFWTDSELGRLDVNELGDIKNISTRRRFLDPITALAEQICYDRLGKKINGISILPPDSERDLLLGLPAGLKLKFENWQMLNNPALVEILRNIHNSLFDIYALIQTSFLGNCEINDAWKRSPLLPLGQIILNINSISWLSDKSKKGLTLLAGCLKNLNPQTMQYFKNNKWARIRHLSMGGLNYSLGMYSQAQNKPERPIINSSPVYLVAQVKLFSDMGGAGVCYMDKIPMVKLSRQADVFSHREAQLRAEFQKEFIKYFATTVQDSENNYWARYDI